MAVMFKRKIKCPRHFLLRPGADPYQRELIPNMRTVPDWAFKKWPYLRKYRIKRDRSGTPVMNRASYYQPEISAAFAIKHIYDPKNPICTRGCKGRCLEGKGNIPHKGERRLG